MASIIRTLYDQYQKDLPYADPNTRDWFLLNNNPVPVWILSIIYLLIVYGGPHYMKSRPAYSLQGFMVVYNLGLVTLSAYMFTEILLSTSQAKYNWMCAEYNAETRKRPGALRVAAVLWWYFFSKAIELMDTILMVLRKKNKQITFLHVFHHVSMVNIYWWVTMFIPGGLDYFGAMLNCSVHVVMYGYYGLSAIPALRGKLWWKSYITRMQLAQFCVILVHGVYSMVTVCDFPLWGKNLINGYMVIMLVLFSNFYMHSYIQSKRRKDKQGRSHHNKVTWKDESTNHQIGDNGWKDDSTNHQIGDNDVANGKKSI